jgi:signal peptidase II
MTYNQGEFHLKRETRERVLPFVLTLAIIALDQATKAIVVATIQPYSIGLALGGDFLRIIHVRNLGIAFSMGTGLPEGIRHLLFILVPLAVMALVAGFSLKANDLTRLQRWALAGIVGGGVGNVFDRIFRPDGVVDFIDVKFYGLFGLDRWPTFNVADSSVVVCGILLIISFLIVDKSGEST